MTSSPLLHSDYLIVGGGMAADAAARGIRELDADGTITILSADVDAPYARPALSKKLWTDPDFTWEKVPLGTVADTGAELRLGTRVASLDTDAHEATTDRGETVGYGRALLVTGSTPQTIPAPDDERIIAFRSAEDYLTLREVAPGRDVVVIGGGYIGAEIAAALVQNGSRVTLVHSDDVLGASSFPPEIAAEYEALFREAGVRLVGGRRAEAVEPAGDAFRVVLDSGELDAEVVVLGLGAAPVVDIAEAAGLAADDGVLVDEHLRTSAGDVWAAGDIASYPDPVLGRTRVEHVDAAQESGAAAGRAMAGSDAPYRHTPYVYSAVFGTRWEAVGTLDGDLDTLIDRLDEERAIVYYLADGVPVGVLLWRVEDATDAARAVLADPPSDPAQLRGRIG